MLPPTPPKLIRQNGYYNQDLSSSNQTYRVNG